MPLGSYTANPDNAAQPLDTVSGGYAAREIRALKDKINTQIQIDTPISLAGSANAYTSVTWPDSLTTGVIYNALVNVTNTGATTITPGAGSAVDVVDLNGDPLTGSMLYAGMHARFYKAASNLVLLNEYVPDASTALAGLSMLVNDLVTNSDTKSLTAAQGVALKGLIDALSSSTTSSLNLKANLNSPTFTGTPLAPTQTTGNNSTRLATTAFVQTAANLRALVNGSTSQRFDVASPNANDQAIRRDTYATSTTGGTVKMRVSGNTLYIRNDGSNA